MAARVVLELPYQVLEVPDAYGPAAGLVFLLDRAALSPKFHLVDFLGAGRSLAFVLVLLERAKVPRAVR